MAHADVDDIAALAVDPDQVAPDVREHVSACVECRALEEALLATAGGLRRAGADEPLVAPPPELRRRVLAALDDERPAAGSPVASLERARSVRRGLPLWMVGLAAGLALVAGVGLGRITADPGEGVAPGDSGSVVAAAGLRSLEGDRTRGEAEAVAHGDVMTLRVSARELGGDPGIHEVWLIHEDGERMVSVGLLASGDEGTFEIPRELLDEGYRIVDISVEPGDGDPTHSGVSLARGELV